MYFKRLSLFALASLSLASAIPSLAKPATKQIAPLAPGIYSDVKMSANTGDLGGIEIKILAGADTGWAEAVYCQGWCNTVDKNRIVATKTGYRFDYRESYSEMDESGKGTKESVSTTIMYIQKTSTGLLVTTGDGEGRRAHRLKKQKKEYGLSVARNDPAQ